MFDVDQGFHQDCPLTGRYQMFAHFGTLDPPYDPCRGLFDLSLDEMQAAFTGAAVQDFRLPSSVDAGQDHVVTDADGSGTEVVTLSATNSTHWRGLSFVWAENGQAIATER